MTGLDDRLEQLPLELLADLLDALVRHAGHVGVDLARGGKGACWALARSGPGKRWLARCL